MTIKEFVNQRYLQNPLIPMNDIANGSEDLDLSQYDKNIDETAITIIGTDMNITWESNSISAWFLKRLTMFKYHNANIVSTDLKGHELVIKADF